MVTLRRSTTRTLRRALLAGALLAACSVPDPTSGRRGASGQDGAKAPGAPDASDGAGGSGDATEDGAAGAPVDGGGSDAPDAPTSSAFVTRQGARLSLNGAPFRFAGPNMTWLGLSEDIGIDYPSHAMIDSAMSDAQTMGATVVRTHGVASVGCAKCIEPALGQFNAQAFGAIDDAIASAKDHGLRLIMILVDNYQFYFGGRVTFTSWRGLPAANFFTDAAVIGDFEAYISFVLSHVNPYTGLAYKDDPTIMAWETGNELSVYPSAWTYSGWTQKIAAHIKDLAPRQLVVDGHYGVDTNSLSLPSVDIYTEHSYDTYRSPAQLVAESNQAHAAGKAFFVGEFDWTGKSGDSLTDLLRAFETGDVTGDLYWQLLPGGVDHNDGYTLHYPGDTADMRTRASQLKDHAARMSAGDVR